jgi:hypothetical protein
MSTMVSARRFVFLSFLPRHYSRSSTIINNLESADQIDFYQIPTGRVQAFRHVRRISKSLLVRTDKIVIMSPSHILSVYARINFKGAIILDAGWGHTDSEIVRLRNIKSFLRLVRSYLIDILSFHSADIVFFESNMQLTRSRKVFFLSDERVRVSYTGVDESAFKVPLQIPKELHVIDEKRKIVLFRGSYNPESGLELISKISRESILSDTTIIVATRNLPAGLRFSENTIVLSRFLEFGEISYLYHLADLTLGQFGKTNRQQISIPHKVFESAFFGKAYLTPTSGSLRELFGKEEIFFEDTFNPECIARAIFKILKNDHLRLDTQKAFKSHYGGKLNSARISCQFMTEIEHKFPESLTPF